MMKLSNGKYLRTSRPGCLHLRRKKDRRELKDLKLINENRWRKLAPIAILVMTFEDDDEEEAAEEYQYIPRGTKSRPRNNL
jgi:hypothetical protein